MKPNNNLLEKYYENSYYPHLFGTIGRDCIGSGAEQPGPEQEEHGPEQAEAGPEVVEGQALPEIEQREGHEDPQLVDIDSDPRLVEHYDCCVPVVVIDGKVRFRGGVNEVLLRRLLRRKPGRPGSGPPP